MFQSPTHPHTAGKSLFGSLVSPTAKNTDGLNWTIELPFTQSDVQPENRFRPIILGIVLFLVINLTVSAALTFVPSLNQKFNAKADNHLPVKLQQLESSIEGGHPPQVLALGTSQTNNDFATKTFEDTLNHTFRQQDQAIKTFNLGLPGTRYDVILTMLKSHIAQHGKPQAILLEVNEPLMEDKTVYYYLPAMHYRTVLEQSPVLIPQVLQSEDAPFEVKQELVLGSLSSFYQYRSLFNPLALPKKVDKVTTTLTDKVAGKLHLKKDSANAPQEAQILPFQPSATMVDSGWQPKDRHPLMLTASGQQETVRSAKSYYLDPIHSVNFAKLKHLLDYCQQENIPVVLVQWPSHPEYNVLFNQAPFARDYHRQLANITNDYDLTLIDLNRHPRHKDTSLYADARHLSPEGAMVFSALLADESAQALAKTSK